MFDEAAFCYALYEMTIHDYSYVNPQYIGYRVEYEDVDGDTVWLGTPLEEGETRTFVSIGHYYIIYEVENTYGNRIRLEAPTDDYPNPQQFQHDVTIVFVAVAS